VLEGEPPEEEIPAGKAVRGESGEEERAAGEGEQIPKARPREGPPGGDSHREGKTARNAEEQPGLSRHTTLSHN
jgi:hypothetical protein